MKAAQRSARNKIQYQDLPPAAVGVCRVRHDKECARKRGNGKYPYLGRFYNPAASLYGLPETVRIQGDKGNVLLAPQWVDFVVDQNTKDALKYIMRPDSGWRNKGEWGKIEQLTFGGCYVVVTRISGNRAYIRSYDNSKRPSDYPNIDFLQQFSITYSDDTIGWPKCGACLAAIVANKGRELWMDVADLTFERPL